MGSTTCHFIPLAGVTVENWPPAIAAYDAVSMSWGVRADPTRRPILAARSRSDAAAHGTSPPLLAAAGAALAALDWVTASAVLVPPTRSAAAPAPAAARTLRRLIA